MNFYSYAKNWAGGSREYRKSQIRLEELQKLTAELDKQLEASKLLLSDVKKIYRHISTPNSGRLRPEQFARFLVADEPRLLMSDESDPDEDDVEYILLELKNNAEYLKKNIHSKSEQKLSSKVNKNVNLKLYVANLDRLSKNLKEMNLSRFNINKELEQSLIRLYQDVNNLTQMVETNIFPSDQDEDLTLTESAKTSISHYDNLITEVIKSTDKVTFEFTHRD